MANERRKSSVTGRRDGPEADDEALWRRVTQDVAPLTRRRQGRVREIADATSPDAMTKGDAAAKSKFADKRAQRVMPAPEPAPTRPTELTHGKAPGLDRKTQTKMRRGQLEVEGRIDLHGLTQTEAHRALIAFISSARDQGKRAVMVITGKGLRETGEVGVLRRAVPGWLNAPPLKSMIRAFDYAARQHGGEGALYVLLKRDRDADRADGTRTGGRK